MSRELTLRERRLLAELLFGNDLKQIANICDTTKADAFAEITNALREFAENSGRAHANPVSESVAWPAVTRLGRDQEGHDERRRGNRTRLFEMCRVVSFDGEIFDNPTLVDVSDGGARLRLATPPRPNQTILLQRAFGEVYTCEVVHVDGDEAGLRFLDNMPSRGSENLHAPREEYASMGSGPRTFESR